MPTLPFSRRPRTTLPYSMDDIQRQLHFLPQRPLRMEDYVREPYWFSSRICYTSGGNGGMHVARTRSLKFANSRRLPQTLDLSLRDVRETGRGGHCTRLLVVSRRSLCSSLPISDSSLYSVFWSDLQALPFNDDLGTSRQSKSKLGRCFRNNG